MLSFHTGPSVLHLKLSKWINDFISVFYAPNIPSIFYKITNIVINVLWNKPSVFVTDFIRLLSHLDHHKWSILFNQTSPWLTYIIDYFISSHIRLFPSVCLNKLTVLNVESRSRVQLLLECIAEIFLFQNATGMFESGVKHHIMRLKIFGVPIILWLCSHCRKRCGFASVV